jgi:hypothetical protein
MCSQDTKIQTLNDDNDVWRLWYRIKWEAKYSWKQAKPNIESNSYGAKLQVVDLVTQARDMR